MTNGTPFFSSGWSTRTTIALQRLLDGMTGLPRQPLFWFSALFLLLAISIQIADPPFRQTIRHAAVDRFQRWRPRADPVHLPLRVATIDHAGLKAWGPWPWPRKRIAEVLERLFESGAAVVVFDVVFAEPDRTAMEWLLNRSVVSPDLETVIEQMPDSDHLLAETMAKGVTVTGFAIDPDGDGPPPPAAKVHFLQPDGPIAPFLPPYRGAVAGMNLFESKARGVGVMSQNTREEDGSIRRLSLLFKVDGTLFPGLPLEAVRLFHGQEAITVLSRPRKQGEAASGIGGLRIGPLFRPLSSRGRVWSHFRPFNPDRYISLPDLMQNRIERQRIDGHIVFIGSTIPGLDNRIDTPLEDQVPGIEFHLQLTEQILDGTYLLRPDWDHAVTVLFLILTWLGLLPMLWTGNAGFSFVRGLPMSAVFVFFSWRWFVADRLLVDALYPLAVVAGLASILMMARYLEGERQRRLVAARSTFLARVSHEIRTPLNAIIGLTRLALHTDLNARQRDHLIKIRASGENLLGIINDILDFSKIDAGMMRLESIPFELDEVLDHVASVTTVKAREKGLELLFSRQPAIPMHLRGDPTRLGQILVNLVGNAVKFTERGEILLSISEVSRDETGIVLAFTVKDTGIGLTPAQCDHLFESFRQVDQSISRKFGGTGLGLAISKCLVEQMGGHIRVKSRLNVGSTFRFTVNLGLAAEEETSAFLPNPDLRGLRVLMLDDNDSSRQIMGTYLQSFGFKAHVAADWPQAATILAREPEPFDLFLLDWPIPGLGEGPAGIARLRAAVGDGRRSRVILVSDMDRERLAGEKGVRPLDNVLSKPVNPSFLFNVIMEAFGREVPERHRRRQKGMNTVLAALAPIRWARILLVEDNAINRQMARELLERAQLVVEEAEDGETAVRMVEKNIYHCILMDIQMPGMDGYETVQRLHGMEGVTVPPILAMTANTMPEDRHRSLAAGMNGHVGKPIQPRELFSALLEWVAPGEYDPPRQEETGETDLEDTSVEIGPLPGIDVAGALSRIEGNRELFRRLLQMFLTDHGDDVRRIRQTLATGDLEEGQRLAHGLKGVSGALGMTAVQRAAERLEQAFKEGMSQAPEPLLAALAEPLADIIDLLKEHLPEETKPKTVEAAPMATDILKRDLIKLDELLRAFDSEALTVARKIAMEVENGQLRKIATLVADRLDQFEFEEAGKQLITLREALGLAPGRNDDHG